MRVSDSVILPVYLYLPELKFKIFDFVGIIFLNKGKRRKKE